MKFTTTTTTTPYILENSNQTVVTYFVDCSIIIIINPSEINNNIPHHQQSSQTTTYEWIKIKLRSRRRRNIQLKGKLSKITGKDEEGFDNSSMQNAMFYNPLCLKYKQGDNRLFISDQGNHIIRSISNISISDDNNDAKWNGKLKIEVGQPKQEGYSNGDQNTCKLIYPIGFDWDMNDNMYICNSSCVCKVDIKSNQVSLVAGHATDEGYKDGDNHEAKFCGLTGILCYQKDDQSQPLLYFCDCDNQCIRMIDVTNYKTTTYAGKGEEKGDADGTLQSARFYFPNGIIQDDENDVFYVSDSFNQKIKLIDIKKGMVSTLVYDTDRTILYSPQQIQIIDSFIYVSCYGFKDSIVRIDKYSKQVTKIKFNDGKQVVHDMLGITYHDLDQCFYLSDQYNIYKLE